MSGLIFDEATHTYTMDGIEIPSVTTILSYVRGDLSKLNRSVLDAAAERGKAVHAACEMMDYGGDPELIPGIEPYLTAYQKFLWDYTPEWVGIEAPVVSSGRTFAGTIDRWGFMRTDAIHMDESPVVLDIKTVASPSTEQKISLCAQTAAYAEALGYYEGCRRFGLYLKKDGNYRLFDCDEWEAEKNFSGQEVFAMCYRLFRQVEAVKAKKRGKKNGI